MPDERSPCVACNYIVVVMHGKESPTHYCRITERQVRIGRQKHRSLLCPFYPVKQPRPERPKAAKCCWCGDKIPIGHPVIKVSVDEKREYCCLQHLGQYLWTLEYYPNGNPKKVTSK